MATDDTAPQSPFDHLARLQDEVWQQLEERMFALSPSSRYDDLLDAVTVPWPESEEFASILLDDLLAVEDDMHVEGHSADSAAGAIARQLQHGEDSVLAERLARLLQAPALLRVAMARAVLSATPRRVNGVRLRTEIRPVSDRSELGDVCVLVHDLRLTFDADGRTSSLNLTLDPPMVRDLWAELVSALAVEDQLRRRLEGVLDVLDPEGEPGPAAGHEHALAASLNPALTAVSVASTR